MSKLLLASNNRGKLQEYLELFAGQNFDLLIPEQIGLNLDVEETGKSYAANAGLKGLAFARASGIFTLADDSGLEVDALHGAPGIHSARYSMQPGADDADRRRFLLQNLAKFPQPWTACFRCVVVLVTPAGDTHFVEGICPGEIISQERGTNGFGYDPIFLLPELGRTMAELSMEEKNRLSHRGRAAQAALPVISSLLTEI